MGRFLCTLAVFMLFSVLLIQSALAEEISCPIKWVARQVAGGGNIDLEYEDNNLLLKLEAAYGYARLENVTVPTNAEKIRVEIVDVSPSQSLGSKNLWRLRIVDPDGKIVNIAGGSAAVPGHFEVVDLPNEELKRIKAGLPILGVELGGAWQFGESVIFRLEFLDANGNSLEFSQLAYDEESEADKMIVVAFGDSITFNRGNLKWKHWTEILAERYPVKIINVGVAGHTTTKGLTRIKQDVLAHQPHIVLISFGMNDHVMRGKNQQVVTLEEYEENLIRMVELIRAADAIPVLVTPNYLYEGDANNPNENYYYNRHDPLFYVDDGGALARLDKFIDIMRKVGSDYNVAVADVRAACNNYNPREFTRDGVHISELGNKVYAQVIGVVFENNGYLQKRDTVK